MDLPSLSLQQAAMATTTGAHRAALAVAVALLLTLLSLGSAQPLVLPYGVHLEELPGFASVQGGAGWPKNISITLVDAPVQVCSQGGVAV